MNYRDFIAEYFPTGVVGFLHRVRKGKPSDPGKCPHKTKYVHRAPTADEWEKCGDIDSMFDIGLSPFLEDGECIRWGVIDIDEYSYSLEDIESRIALFQFPLTPIQSKSGGWQLLVSIKERAKAKDVRKALTKMAVWMGFDIASPKIEILPKQSSIIIGEKDVGTAMILPKACHMDEVIQNSISIKDWNALMDEGLFNEGPPCLFPLFLAHKRADGSHRNDFIYQCCVYFKYKFPTEWQEKAFEVNSAILPEPLEDAEINTIIKQHEKGDLFFKCKGEPFESVCNKELCKQRKYGIRANSPTLSRIDMDGMTMLETDPPIWFMTLVDSDGVEHRVRLESEDLYRVERFKKRCMETIFEIPETPNQKNWHKLLNNYLKNATRISVPPDLTEAAKLSDWIYSYIDETVPTYKPENLTKNFIYVEEGEQLIVYFRTINFHNWLEATRRKAGTLAELGGKLIQYSRDGSLPIKQARISDLKIDVWRIPIQDPLLKSSVEIHLDRSPERAL